MVKLKRKYKKRTVVQGWKFKPLAKCGSELVDLYDMPDLGMRDFIINYTLPDPSDLVELARNK